MQKTTNTTITKIIVFIIFIILLLEFVIIISSKFIFTSNNKIIYNRIFSATEITNININTTYQDIKVEESKTNDIELTVYGNNKKEVTITKMNNSLNIKKQKYSNFSVGFRRVEDEIIIKIPKSYNKNIYINTISGDISITNFINLSMNLESISGNIDIVSGNKTTISTRSGNISIKKVNMLTSTTTSGDINIKSVNKSCRLKTTSGDIEIKNININTTSSINTVSGDIEIENIGPIYINTKTITGDVKIKKNNRFNPLELKIKTTSGNISVE